VTNGGGGSPQRQEVVVKKVALTFLIVLVVHAVANAQSSEPHYTPSTVTIKPEKTELMPGEEIDLVLTDFADYAGSFVGEARMVRVRAEQGSIWNLHTWVRNSGYIFQIGSGKIVVKYRAPIIEGGTDVVRVDVIVTNIHHIEEPAGIEEGDSMTIGEQELKIVTVDNVEMKYHVYYRNDQGEVPSIKDITVIVGLHLEMLKPDHPSSTVPLRGFGAGDPYRVTSATVYSASGTFSGKDCSYRVVSASPAHWNTALMVYNDQKTGAIESVKLPLISAILSWTGDGGCVPPESVEIGPVTEWDAEADQKKFERLADEIEVDMEVKGYPDMADIMKMQQAIKKVVVHPDYMAKIQISQDHAGNEARFLDSGDGWRLEKEFSWEIERDLSGVPLVKK
jgi:hypothetical protein